MKTLLKTTALALLISSSVGFANDADGTSAAPSAASYLNRLKPSDADVRTAVVAIIAVAAYKAAHKHGASPVCHKLAEYLPAPVGNLLVSLCDKCEV